MSIDQGNFDDINEADLQELIDGSVTESLRLDFKLTQFGNSDSYKRELLKDASAMANSQGGHLVLGVKESKGVATELKGIKVPDLDREILRMEQILNSGLEPRVSGIRMKAIPLANGQSVVLIRIPRSWRLPHRVIANGSNRFFIRHSAGIHQPSVEELRMLFSQSASALDRARQFRDERTTIICAGEDDRPLLDNGRLILHIVPSATYSGMVNLDVEQLFDRCHNFQPIGAMGMTSGFDFFGFINKRGGDENHGYTRVFRNGCIEATLANIVCNHSEHPVIAGKSLERKIFEQFSPYIEGLRDVGVPPPLIVMFTLEGVRGATYEVKRAQGGGYGSPLPLERMLLPECVLEEYGTTADHHRAVQPAFNALWNAIGFSGSQFFDKEGVWRDGQN